MMGAATVGDSALQSPTDEMMARIKSANSQAEQMGETPFDAFCIRLMDRVAKFFSECASDPDFAGLSIDETRDEFGRVLSLRLVPCDLIGGEPARRVER